MAMVRRRLLVLSLAIPLVVLLVQAGCYAPQRPGFQRTTYLTLATTDGALLGGVGAMLGCEVLTGDLWRHKRSETSKTALACGVAGMLAGGIGAYWGSAESENEPDRAVWVTVSLPWVAVGAALVIAGYNQLIGKRL